MKIRPHITLILFSLFFILKTYVGDFIPSGVEIDVWLFSDFKQDLYSVLINLIDVVLYILLLIAIRQGRISSFVNVLTCFILLVLSLDLLQSFLFPKTSFKLDLIFSIIIMMLFPAKFSIKK